MGASKVKGYAALQATCAKLPKRSLLNAVAGITYCSKSTCNDGRLNGDEVGIDCSGSCAPCDVNTTVLSLPAPSPACELSSLRYRLARVAEACPGTSMVSSEQRTRTGCDVDCAASFIPFYEECANTFDLVFRTSGCVDADAKAMRATTHGIIPNCGIAREVHLCTRDKHTAMAMCPITCGVGCGDKNRSKTAMFHDFQRSCLSVPQSALLARLDSLDARKCALNISGVVANGDAPIATGGCKDDNAGMLEVSGQTCNQVRTAGFCHFKLLPPLCGCSCSGAARRKTQTTAKIGYHAHAAQCKMEVFDTEVARLNDACCNETDIDDKCVDGVPLHCARLYLHV